VIGLGGRAPAMPRSRHGPRHAAAPGGLHG
jgi:hypothetical protein